ncbi:MAG: hypothetical protein HQK79_22215 [Desulfobacterales bacterium]|nr:hypothetical protein [Desulfobacterales bacterium]
MEIPTLLIGLGGIGSQVVEKVYSYIPPENRNKIAVHAFDTNINDISKRKHLKGKITQTSSNWSVGEYLDMSDSSIKEWFPDDNRELRNKQLTDGAGEVRCISRLAYRASIQQQKLNLLQEQIKRLFAATGEQNTTVPRIMIASSLSGGTGSGIFLQVAMYLQEYLMTHYHQNIVSVRGAFLLPDVLVLNKVADEAHSEALRSNGYACLMELDAITSSVFGHSKGQHEVTIELEYRPDQTDSYNRQNPAITSQQPPYKFVFLYDFENIKGENLGDLKNYIDQMADTIFIQLFSPLSSAGFSHEDNQLNTLIKGKSINRYCGAGTASITYPYDDIVDYFAYKLAYNTISKEWMYLDELFEREMAQYKRDLEVNAAREKPERGKRFTTTLESISTQDNPVPFFRQIYLSTRILDDRGKEIGSKSMKFLDSVRERINEVLKNDDDIQEALSACLMDEGKLKNKNQAKDTVTRMEVALEDLQNIVFKAVHSHKVFILHQILGQDCDSPNGLGHDKDYCLNAWMLKRLEAIHPVGVRYILYQIKIMLKEELGKLYKENNDIESNIKKYEDRYDDPETGTRENPIVESVYDRIRIALSQPFYKRLFDNKFNEFIEEYQQKSKQQLDRLKKFQSSKLTELVFEGIQKAVESLIEFWERYFEGLKSVQIKLLENINKMAGMHEGLIDPTRKYVLASKDAKEKLWKEIESSGSLNESIPPGLIRKLYVGIYKQFCNNFYSRRNIAGTEMNTSELFDKDVLDWYRKNIKEKDRLRMNVIDALKEQARLYGENFNLTIKEYLSAVDQLAQPLVPSPKSTHSNFLTYWGGNPQCFESLTEEQISECFKGSGVEIIKDSAFSPTKIIRYRGVYGYKAEDFPKFQAPNPDEPGTAGLYYKAYRKRIKDMENDEAVTPHLDKRWHLPAYMAPIGDKIGEIEQTKVIKGFLLGIIHGILSIGTDQGREIWEYSGGGSHGRKSIMMNRKQVQGKFYDLYKAMFYNPAIVDGIHKQSEIIRQKEINKFGIKTAPIGDRFFIEGCRKINDKGQNIFDAVFLFVKESPSEDLRETTRTLLIKLMDEIIIYFIAVYGAHREITAKNEAVKYLIEIIGESQTYKEAADENSPVYRSWDDCIKNFLKQNTP